jgi:hypothetical protein
MVVYETRVLQGSGHDDIGLPGCNAVWIFSQLPKFKNNILSLSSTDYVNKLVVVIEVQALKYFELAPVFKNISK